MAFIKKYKRPFPVGLGIRRRVAPFHKTDKSMKYCIDFAMPLGTPILAARAGTVLENIDHYKKNYSDPKMSDKCNLITLMHPDGQTSIYIHLSWRSSRVKIGDVVEVGQIIALSGNTGYAGYPHLHFGVYDSKGESIPVYF